MLVFRSDEGSNMRVLGSFLSVSVEDSKRVKKDNRLLWEVKLWLKSSQ